MLLLPRGSRQGAGQQEQGTNSKRTPMHREATCEETLCFGSLQLSFWQRIIPLPQSCGSLYRSMQFISRFKTLWMLAFPYLKDEIIDEFADFCGAFLLISG